MATNNWSDAAPLGSVNANTIDEEIRKAKLDVRERMAQGGHKFAGTPTFINTNENNDGKHCVGIEDEVGDDTGIQTLSFDFAGTTGRIITYGSSHGSKPDETDFPGPINLPSGDKLNGLAAGSVLRASMGDALPILSTYIKRVVYKVPNYTGALSRTLTKAGVIVGTRPVSTNLVIEVRQIDASALPLADSTDRYLDASSSIINTITLTAGANFSVENSGLSLTLDPDDEIILKYGSTVGGALDATIVLQVE